MSRPNPVPQAREGLDTREKQLETAPWRVKGDGVGYTTSAEILSSKAAQRQLIASKKIKLG